MWWNHDTNTNYSDNNHEKPSAVVLHNMERNYIPTTPELRHFIYQILRSWEEDQDCHYDRMFVSLNEPAIVKWLIQRIHAHILEQQEDWYVPAIRTKQLTEQLLLRQQCPEEDEQEEEEPFQLSSSSPLLLSSSSASTTSTVSSLTTPPGTSSSTTVSSRRKPANATFSDAAPRSGERRRRYSSHSSSSSSSHEDNTNGTGTIAWTNAKDSTTTTPLVAPTATPPTLSSPKAVLRKRFLRRPNHSTPPTRWTSPLRSRTNHHHHKKNQTKRRFSLLFAGKSPAAVTTPPSPTGSRTTMTADGGMMPDHFTAAMNQLSRLQRTDKKQITHERKRPVAAATAEGGDDGSLSLGTMTMIFGLCLLFSLWMVRSERGMAVSDSLELAAF